MHLIPFTELPDHSRLWIFTSDRTFDEADRPQIEEQLIEFLRSWNAHGKPVEAGYEIRDRKFILIGASDRAEDPSGCSIDALTRFLREMGQKYGYNLMSSPLIHYRTESGEIVSVPRPAFRAAIQAGIVTGTTPVFDASFSKIGDLRIHSLEVPAGSSWHAEAFGIPQQ